MYSHAYIRIYVYVHTYVCIGILLNYNVIVIESYFFLSLNIMTRHWHKEKKRT